MRAKPNYLVGWLSATRPDQVMRVLFDNGWLRCHAPEVHALYGVPQNPEHHPEVDTGRHTELVLQMAAQLSADPKVRYAALVHDLGKALTPAANWPRHINHEQLGVRPGLKLGQRLGVPKDWRLLGALVAKYHLRVHKCLELSARSTVRLLDDVGLYERPKLLEPFLLACEADARGREGLQDSPYPQPHNLRQAFAVSCHISKATHGVDYHSERIRAVEKDRKEPIGQQAVLA